MDRIRVLIADDHVLFRRGVAEVLSGEEGLEVVAQASDGREAVEKALESSPDIILMDLAMPGMGGLEATAELRQRLPEIKVLILTVSEEEADLLAALEKGARGYILKEAGPQELVQAVLQAAQGWVIVSPPLATKLLSKFTTAKKRLTPLTEREREILGLVARGLGNHEIAEALFISINTVKTHLRSIFDKLQLKGRAQAAAYGVESGLLQDEDRSPR